MEEHDNEQLQEISKPKQEINCEIGLHAFEDQAFVLDHVFAMCAAQWSIDY
jgi:hypothetical protein